MSNELIDFVIVSVALLAIGIYGLAVKRNFIRMLFACLLYTSPSPRDMRRSRMPSSA